jgi:NTE family protein
MNKLATEAKTVSLVLGSGGARGLAHIGIIRWLEEHGYQIRSVSGCSMGALIGGIYAAGKLPEYEQWVRNIDKLGVFSLLDFTFGRGGLVRGEKLIATLRELVGETLIEELPITFTAVAADIVREREVWLNKGPLFDAIRASISLPLFFTPFNYQGINLIDGSVFNPVPIAPTFHDLTDLTIAVNLNGPPESAVAAGSDAGQEASTADEAQTFAEKIRKFITDLQNGESEPAGDKWDMFYVVNQSFDAMQGLVARQKLAAHPPDLLVSIPRNACGTLDFDRAAEMIARGYQAAEEQLGRGSRPR